jgi:hypothetical protein
MDDWSGEVSEESHHLTTRQVIRLLRLTELLRRDEWILETIAAMKRSIAEECYQDALVYWADFTEAEQMTLWMAPKFGGIWTTEERKALRPTTTEGE